MPHIQVVTNRPDVRRFRGYREKRGLVLFIPRPAWRTTALYHDVVVVHGDLACSCIRDGEVPAGKCIEGNEEGVLSVERHRVVCLVRDGEVYFDVVG